MTPPLRLGSVAKRRVQASIRSLPRKPEEPIVVVGSAVEAEAVAARVVKHVLGADAPSVVLDAAAWLDWYGAHGAVYDALGQALDTAPPTALIVLNADLAAADIAEDLRGWLSSRATTIVTSGADLGWPGPTLRVPAVREWLPNELADAAAEVLERLAERRRYRECAGMPVSSDALAALGAYPWKDMSAFEEGLRRSVLAARGNEAIGLRHLPPPVRAHYARQSVDEHEPLAAVTRRHVLFVLDACGGHLGRTAERLEIARRTLKRKLDLWASEASANAERSPQPALNGRRCRRGAGARLRGCVGWRLVEVGFEPPPPKPVPNARAWGFVEVAEVGGGVSPSVRALVRVFFLRRKHLHQRPPPPPTRHLYPNCPKFGSIYGQFVEDRSLSFAQFVEDRSVIYGQVR